MSCGPLATGTWCEKNCHRFHFLKNVLTCAQRGWKIHMHDPHQGQIMTGSHVWKKRANGASLHKCTFRHARTLQRGSQLCQSDFMTPLWSRYTGRAQSRQGCCNNATIESEEELPALSLSKQHVNYSCKGQQRSCDNTDQKQSGSQVCITNILSRGLGPLVGVV